MDDEFVCHRKGCDEPVHRNRDGTVCDYCALHCQLGSY
jgi:hypothetical protein